MQCLDDVGVRVGPKTTRNRLLELLNQHVTRKKLRVDNRRDERIRSARSVRGRGQHDQRVAPSSPALQVQATPGPAPEESLDPMIERTSKSKSGLSLFNDSQLAELLQTVGVDTRALNRATLIDQCNTYHELSECRV